MKFLSPADTWPQGAAFNYHAGSGNTFDKISWYTNGVNNRYGTTTSAQDYSNKSELLSYESTRAFFEAWNAHEYTGPDATFGTIFWMQNNAWPSIHWSLYDYYFKPAGGFFGSQKANEPVHVAYDYNTKKIYTINSTLTANNNMTVVATVYNIPTLAQMYTNQVVMNIPANASTLAFTIPTNANQTTTYFIRLQIKTSTNPVVSDNLYW